MDDFKIFLGGFQVGILPVDLEVSEQFVNRKVKLEHQGWKLADFDLLIASTAIVHKLTLVINNTRHVSRIKNLQILK